jgi:GNAT superfamily N-acetyltransferase
MTETVDRETLEPLDVLVAAWSMVTSFAPNPADAPRALTTFEWLSGRRFLIQRWEVEHPDAPDGIAIIGFDAEKAHAAALLRLAWRRARVRDDYRRQGLDAPTVGSRSRLLAALHRHLDDENNTIVGRWEISSDGSTWNHDFDLTCTRLR